jgi:hypothetical protein
MKDIFKIAHLSNDAVRMVGLHGIGKSQVVEQFAKENDYHIETLFLSQNEVADLIGIPDMKDGITYWTKPIWLKRMEDASASGKHCVLFLDELARAPIEVRQSALQLVLEGRIHEHWLPQLDGIKSLIVAADNPAEEYQTDELDPALLDRFGNYTVSVDVNGWLKWARLNNINPVITDYIAEYSDKLHWIPEDDNDKGATPRSWAKLSNLLVNAENAGVNKGILAEIIKSKLGETIGYSFLHFYNDYVKIVKPQDIEKAIGKYEKTVDGFKAKAKEIKSITENIEALAASELANKIKDLTKKDDKWNDILAIYLDSLNVEVFVSIIKTWKESEEDAEFYYEWAESIPEAYIFTKILRIKEES